MREGWSGVTRPLKEEPSPLWEHSHKSNRLNVGGLSFTYGIETDDISGGDYAFNARFAAWITFARGLFGACQTMYRNRESAGCFNSEVFLAKMKAWQETRPERLWVADAQRKYLRPYEDNGTITYLPMLAGRKTHQREQVKVYNAYYYASKYVSDFCTSRNIMVRGNTPTTWRGVEPQNKATLAMYIDCYIVVASTSYNVVAKTRAKRGIAYEMDFSTIGRMGETELYFCTAPMIQELSGLAHLYFKQNNFAMATNLQRLEVGSSIEGYSNPNLEGLTIDNNRMLEYLDVRNCPNATGALNLSKCVSLKELYLENTAFTGISFAPAGLLETAHLPSPTSITMRDLIYLTDLTIDSTRNLATLRVENCDFADTAVITIGNTSTSQGTQDIIITLIDSATNLSRVRLVGLDWTLPNTTLLERLRRMAGIGDDGYDIVQSVLTGETYIPTMRQSQLDRYAIIWPYLDITYSTMITQYAATFMNADGTPILDINGNAYVQWVDSGGRPYDPTTMGYNITISGNGTPTASGYDASDYNGEYYLDTLSGNIYYSNGSTWDAVDIVDVFAPTLAETQQYTYTFSGWDDITTVMGAPRTITAQYTATEKTYTVTFWRDNSQMYRRITDVPYGGCVDYAPSDVIIAYEPTTPGTAGYSASAYKGKYFQNTATGIIYYSNGSSWSAVEYLDCFVAPTYTDDEAQLTYRVFKGWDKSSGNVTGNIDVYAVWITNTAWSNKEMSQMNLAEIYGICQAGLQSAMFEPLDYIDLKMGNDFNFSNVESVTIGEKYDLESSETVLNLTGVTKDKYISGGYYFNGSTYYQTDISLFADDAPAFTMAIDFDFIASTNGSTLISANYGTTENFRIASNGTYVTLYWGNTTLSVAYPKRREMLVIRHPKGSNSIYVYTAGYQNATSTKFAETVTKTTLTRTTTPVDEPLALGAVNYHTTSNTYRNYGTGHIHWLKIWYDDLGESNAYILAEWCHEKCRAEYWGAGKYELSDESGDLSGGSFIFNNPLGSIFSCGYYMNPTNVNAGGWDASSMISFLNDRIIKAMPIPFQCLIRQVQINATTGNQATTIKRSDCKVYLQSLWENGGTSSGGYDQEIGADASSPRISWFSAQSGLNTANAQRIKFHGFIREYNLPNGNTTAYDGNPMIYSCTDDPAAYYSTDIAQGSIWLDSNDSSRGYIFMSTELLNQYGITPAFRADSNYADGGWVLARYWWERSPFLGGSTSFLYVSSLGGPSYGNNASYVYGVVPSFSI